MPDLTQDPTNQAGNAPATDIYSQMLTAGFSQDEVKNWVTSQKEDWQKAGFTDEEIQKEFLKASAAKPIPQPQDTATITERGPAIPKPPPPVPGTYSPEQEQNAMRAADAIKDPESRLRVQQYLKREYANDAIIDGINAKAREEAEKTAVGEYSHAIKQIRDDPRASWQQKENVVKQLTETMWNDPRLKYGEVAGRLEKYMQTLAGIEDTTDLGPGYSKALDGLTTGQLKTVSQVLQMENDHTLTGKGASEILRRLGQMDKPDARVITQRENLAMQHAKNIVFHGADENDMTGMNKPSPKQWEKLNQFQYMMNDALLATGGDQDKIAKLTAPDAVREMVESIYPVDEQRFDYVNKGMGSNFAGITIPPNVAQENQNEYKWIVGAPPSAINPKTGKQELIPIPGWQEAIERLRRNPTPQQIETFDKKFPGQDAAHIVKMLPTVAAPPGATPPPTIEPAEAPAGFWQRFKPSAVPGPDILSAIQEWGNRLLAEPPAQEAKK